MANKSKGGAKKSWYSMQMAADTSSDADIYIYDYIGYYDTTADDFRKELDALGDVDHIHLHLNCPGGDVFDGTAIYNLLKNHPASVEVTIEGVAASMGSVVALAGNPVRIADNGYFMIHNPSTGAYGDEKRMEQALSRLKTVKATMVGLYAARSGMEEEDVIEAMNDETWYSGKAAVEAGFCDESTGEVELAASFDLSAFGKVPIALSASISQTPAGAGEIQTSEGITMTKKVKRAPEGEDPAVNEVSAQQVEDAVDKGVKAHVAAENKRREAVVAAFEGLGHVEGIDDLKQECLLDMACSGSDAGDRILAKMREQNKSTQPTHSGLGVFAPGGGREKLLADAASAIAVRMGWEEKPSESNGLASYSMMDVARAILQSHGLNNYSNRMELVGAAFTHQSGDFAALLSGLSHKAMLKGFDEAEEVFDQFTSKGTLTDFKVHQRVDIGHFPSLRMVKEGAEFKYVTLDDRAEQTMLATYGERFSITRQAVINDDLDALKRLPKKFGGAARRTVGDLVFAILLGNPKMGDGVELFHASHGNLAPAGLINSATVDAGRVLMGTQKDGDVALNIRPAFLLTGISDESDATLTMTSDTEHRDDAKESRRKNAVRGLAKVLSDARLEEADAWFMSANHNVHDVIEVQYLDGDEKPRLEQQNGWSVDGVEYKVAIDAAAKAWDHKGLVKTPKS